VVQLVVEAIATSALPVSSATRTQFVLRGMRERFHLRAIPRKLRKFALTP
jgi:hypothetical protein